jgi:hypothetical protein
LGAWGPLAFDNDTACDWAARLKSVDNLSLVVGTFAEIGDDDGYLDSEVACQALAACEVLARLQGNSGYQNAYTKDVDDWVIGHPMRPPNPLLKRADEVIERILGEQSELRALWAEADGTRWRDAVEDLRQRLDA